MGNVERSASGFTQQSHPVNVSDSVLPTEKSKLAYPDSESRVRYLLEVI